MPASEVAQKVIDLADTVDASLNKLGLLFPIELKRFAQFTQFGYPAQFLQVPYAYLFKDLSETEIDHLLQGFAFKNCCPNEPLVAVLKKHFQRQL